MGSALEATSSFPLAESEKLFKRIATKMWLKLVLAFVLLQNVCGVHIPLHQYLALTQNHVPYVYPAAFMSPLTRVMTLSGPMMSVYQVEHPPADIITPDGLKIEVVTTNVQCERRVNSGDLVSAHYTGTLQSGEVFDSSKGEDGQGEPIKFIIGVGKVIKGWDQGLVGRCLNDKVHLSIPSELGYGEKGTDDGVIPPGARLEFDVEIVGVEDAETDEGPEEKVKFF